MPLTLSPSDFMEMLQNTLIYFIGVKGTGMCALAEILIARGAKIAGADVSEIFYTDRILAELGIEVTTFENAVLPAETKLVIRSAAYDEEHPLVLEALKRKRPVYTYPQALGLISQAYDAWAVAGVHGKTTTAALAGTLIKALNLNGSAVTGSAVADFGNRSTWLGGNRFLVAETCEYRRHFLYYRPRNIVLTSVESDHQDYYPDYPAIRDAFVDFVLSLPESGKLIYCADDAGANDVIQTVKKHRQDIQIIPYGETAKGPWQISYLASGPGNNSFRIAAFDKEFRLNIPGRHMVQDAVAAMALILSVEAKADIGKIAMALESFRGSRRRSEIIGESGGILVMDDYAHHPTAIVATLKGLREFYPNKRLVVDFMPHTFSRTAALLEQFATSFDKADLLILHPVYASARENSQASVSGKDLAVKVARLRPENTTVYHQTFDESLDYLRSVLKPGDLFITLGAGDNWSLGHQLFQEINT